MSYSVYAVFDNAETKNNMLAFLSAQYRPFSLIAGDNGLKGAESMPADTVSYPGDEKNFVGFDYQAGADHLRSYLFRICAWMAVASGNLLEGKWKHFVYDGYDETVLITADQLANLAEEIEYDYMLCDDLGFWPVRSRSFSPSAKEQKALGILNEQIRAEIFRLDTIWKAIRESK